VPLFFDRFNELEIAGLKSPVFYFVDSLKTWAALVLLE
jgi:hypothetical protein